MHLTLPMESWALCLGKKCRVTHQVVLQVLFTSKQKLCFSVRKELVVMAKIMAFMVSDYMYGLEIVSDVGLGAVP